MSDADTQINESALWSLFAAMQQRRRSSPRSQGKAYDYSHPHRFTPRQCRALKDFADVARRLLSGGMSATLRTKFRLAEPAVGQLYLRDIAQGEPSYFVQIVVDGEVAGFLQYPRPTALQLVSKMLGGVDDDNFQANRQISALESDLLLDLSERVTESLSRAAVESGGPGLGMIREVGLDVPELATHETIVECIRLELARQRQEDKVDLPFSMLLLSEVVEPMAGYVRPPAMSAAVARAELLGHVNEVPMPVKVCLDSADVTLRDIACLEAGDVILLRTQVNQPIDVIVSGKTVMKGRPVQHHGFAAVQVAQMQDT